MGIMVYSLYGSCRILSINRSRVTVIYYTIWALEYHTLILFKDPNLRLLRGSWALWARVWALGAKVRDLTRRLQEH